METTKQLSEHLESMKTLANMLLAETAKGEKILEKMGRKKSIEEMEIEEKLLHRKLRIIKSCTNKKALLKQGN